MPIFNRGLEVRSEQNEASIQNYGPNTIKVHKCGEKINTEAMISH